MIGSDRARLPQLAALCRRLAISSNAGIDDRRVWDREAKHARGGMRRRLQQVRDAVAQGGDLADALAATGEYFPSLVREMVEIGEQTGSLPDVFDRLADHYERQVKLRRDFLVSITWPMIQLAAAVVIVGALIVALGIVNRGAREPIDPLGFGLVGTPGLIRYLAFVAAAGGGAWLVIGSVRRGATWTRPLQRLLLRLPVVGGSLRTLALSRMAWSLHLTLNVAMDIRRAAELALRGTGYEHYIRHTDQVLADLSAGREIHDALRRTGAVDADFLDQVEVAEQSGRMVESMGRLSDQYDEKAQAALTQLGIVAGFAVWAVVALAIAAVILRLGMFYINSIYRVMN